MSKIEKIIRIGNKTMAMSRQGQDMGRNPDSLFKKRIGADPAPIRFYGVCEFFYKHVTSPRSPFRKTSERSNICRLIFNHQPDLGEVARFQKFFLVFFCVLSALVVNLPNAYGQLNNEEIYDSLGKNFQDSIKQINLHYSDSINRVSQTGPYYILFSEPFVHNYRGSIPSVTYTALGKKKIEREIISSFGYEFRDDTLMRSKTFTYTDTLTLKQLKQVQKASPPDFRSEIPSNTARIYIPFAIVAGSIGAVISLFYIRSR